MPYKPNGVASVLHAKRCHELESAISFASHPSSPLSPTLPPWMGCPIDREGWIRATTNPCEIVCANYNDNLDENLGEHLGESLGENLVTTSVKTLANPGETKMNKYEKR